MKANRFLCIKKCVFTIQKLVVKPDQLIKRRGKLGLLKVNTDWEGVKEWLAEKRGKTTQVSYGSP